MENKIDEGTIYRWCFWSGIEWPGERKEELDISGRIETIDSIKFIENIQKNSVNLKKLYSHSKTTTENEKSLEYEGKRNSSFRCAYRTGSIRA